MTRKAIAWFYFVFVACVGLTAGYAGWLLIVDEGRVIFGAACMVAGLGGVIGYGVVMLLQDLDIIRAMEDAERRAREDFLEQLTGEDNEPKT